MTTHSHAHDHAPGPLADASVRSAKVTDAPAVGLVQSIVWKQAYADVVPDAVRETFEAARFAASWRRTLNDPPPGAYRLLVACAGEQVVGFASLGPAQDPDTDQTTAELSDLCVHPDARRSGHGSRLLNAAVDTVRGLGGATMTVWVLAQDEGVAAFLAASGFEPDGARRSRVVGPDGEQCAEVRLVASLAPESEPDTTTS